MGHSRGTAPSLVDVARAAGVSTATAGRALGGYGPVSEAARSKVAAAAEALGYTTNSLARSMITGHTHIIGVVVPDVANPFFATALRGISDVVNPAGFEVQLANTGRDPASEKRALHVMSQQRVDGAIVAPAHPDRGAHIQQLVRTGLPVVLLDRQARGVTNGDSVAIENELAAQQAVEHLLDLGHQRIAIVTEADGTATPGMPQTRRKTLLPSAQRLLGYLAALEAAGLPSHAAWVATATYDRTSAHAATTKLLKLEEPPTAVLCTDNVLASGALRAIQDEGLRIPDDISLIGFDDEPWTTLVRPELTVVEQPTYHLGVEAGQQLLARMESTAPSTKPRHIRLQAHLIIRDSTGPVRSD